MKHTGSYLTNAVVTYRISRPQKQRPAAPGSLQSQHTQLRVTAAPRPLRPVQTLEGARRLGTIQEMGRRHQSPTLVRQRAQSPTKALLAAVTPHQRPRVPGPALAPRQVLRTLVVPNLPDTIARVSMWMSTEMQDRVRPRLTDPTTATPPLPIMTKLPRLLEVLSRAPAQRQALKTLAARRHPGRNALNEPATMKVRGRLHVRARNRAAGPPIAIARARATTQTSAHLQLQEALRWRPT
jgi:hypothetical protein